MINPRHEASYLDKDKRYLKKRLYDTRCFVEKALWYNWRPNAKILAIAQSGQDMFDRAIFDSADCVPDTVDWNYFYLSTHKKYDIVTCFEAMEHLLNPLLFLENLKEYIAKDGLIFISYPYRNSLFWSDIHFHEYDIARFRYLIKTAGYKILAYKEVRMYSWHGFGIRPLLRLTPIGCVKRQYYCLEKM